MKNRNWLCLVAVVLVGLSVLVAQGVYQRNLINQVGAVEKKVERLKVGLLKRSGEKLSVAGSGEGIHTGKGGVRSEERIEAANLEVDVFLKSVGDTRSPVSFLKGLPDFMRSIEDLNAKELLALVARLEGEGGSGVSSEANEMLSGLLLSLAGEVSSERNWESLDELEGEAQAMLFTSMARRDPDAAIQWLKGKNLPPMSRNRMAQALISLTLAQEPIAALEMIRELGTGWESFQGKMPMKLDGGKVSQLEAAFKEPKNADLQKQIVSILMRSASSGGVASLKQQAERLDLSGAELMGLVFSGQTFHQPKETGEFLDWMVEIVPQDHPEMPKTIFNAAQQWANRDFGAAAEWLGDLKPSKSRDFAIEGFVYSVAQLDPEAAALWALEVQGSKKRETVLAHAMKAWRQKDAVKADSWLERREGELKVSE